MPNLELSGVKVVHVSEVETKGTNNFETRHVVVKSEDNPQYPQFHKIDFNGEKTDKLDKVKVGDFVDVTANINGRKWTDRAGEDQYFNALDGWKIKVTQAAPVYAPPVDISSAPDDDDLPF